MTVLDRSELQASPLADLYMVAAQVGLEGYRRMRKAELIDAILLTLGDDDADSPPAPLAGGRDSARSAPPTADDEPPADDEPSADDEPHASEDPPASDGGAVEGAQGRGSMIRRRRFVRARRGRSSTAESQAAAPEPSLDPVPSSESERERPPVSKERPPVSEEHASVSKERSPVSKERPPAGRSSARESDRAGSRGGSSEGTTERAPVGGGSAEEITEGVVELQGNGSAFLRVAPPESSDRDVYVSAGQVRRCELVSGDRVSGPIRPPRRSERYPSLVRVDAVNGTSTSSREDVQRYEDLPVVYPTHRLALGAEDPTLRAIEWLTPIGLGSRALIVGAARAGKTETLRSLVSAVAGQDDLEVILILSGVRPEEASSLWEGVGVQATSKSTLGVSADVQGQAVERAIETAQRMAIRGTDVVVAVDTLDGLHPHTARKLLASARNLKDSGSLTIVATASKPLGGETTIIALDVTMTSTGRLPALDLRLSGTCKPELLVGEDGAKAIVAARAAALEL